MSMSVNLLSSNPQIQAIQSEWEKTPEGSWQRLKVEVSDKGDIKVQRIAQGAFLHFLSYVVERVTFGRIKDAFCKKYELINLHVDPSAKNNFLEEESRRIAKCVEENKTFSAIYTAIITPFATVKGKVQAPEIQQPKEIPAQVLEWREAKLQTIRDYLEGSEKNQITSLIDRFQNIDMLFGLKSLFESRRDAWHTLQMKTQAVTDATVFEEIEWEIFKLRLYDDYLLGTLNSIKSPHAWLEKLRNSLTDQCQSFFFTSDRGPSINDRIEGVGGKTVEELDKHFKRIAKEMDIRWHRTPSEYWGQQKAEAGHLVMTVDAIKEAASITANLHKHAEEYLTAHRDNTLRFADGEVRNFITAFYDQLKPIYNPNATLDELISSAKTSLKILTDLMGRLPGSEEPTVEGLAEVEALATASENLADVVEVVEDHLKTHGDTSYLSSAKLATILSDLADAGKNVSSFEALSTFNKKVIQTKEKLEKDLVFAQFVKGKDLPTELLNAKERALRMLQEHYRLGNMETMHAELNVQRAAIEEMRKGFLSKGWFTTTIIPIEQLTEAQIEEYQTQVMNAVTKAINERGQEGILLTVGAHLDLQNVIKRMEKMIDQEGSSDAAATLNQTISKYTQNLAKQAENFPSTNKTLQTFAVSIRKTILDIIAAYKKYRVDQQKPQQSAGN